MAVEPNQYRVKMGSELNHSWKVVSKREEANGNRWSQQREAKGERELPSDGNIAQNILLDANAAKAKPEVPDKVWLQLVSHTVIT